MNRPDIIVPFAAIAVLLITIVAIYLRQGRNRVLEEIVEKHELGPISGFRGTLAVQESRPGFFLRLNKNSKGRRLQFLYRWIVGLARKAMVDEITFDAARQSVELTRNNHPKSMPFANFSAVVMRESSAMGGQFLALGDATPLGGNISVWHVELVPMQGSRLLFLTSEPDDRQRAFERTAAVAKAVATIMALSVQVVVDGKAWTFGWPPKSLLS